MRSGQISLRWSADEPGPGRGRKTTCITFDDPSWASSSSSSAESSDSSTSGSSSTTTSAKGDTPEIPEAATKHTKAGATAFAKWY